MVSLEEGLVTLLLLFGVAAAVGLLSAMVPRIQYTTALFVAGAVISVVGAPVEFTVTSELILLVLLPALVFNDAVRIDVAAFRENIVPILALAVAGLLLSIAVVTVLGPVVFGFSVAVAVLFGAILMPTDPVSVLAVFEKLGVPERLHVLVEGESLLNDGVSIVVYSTVLAVLLQAESQGVPAGQVVDFGEFLTDVGVGVLVAMVGGGLVGVVAGSIAAEIVSLADDETTAVVVSVLLAYGVYVFLDLLGSSGVIGTLTAGIVLAARVGSTGVTDETRTAVWTMWETLAILVNTLVFVAIGLVTPFGLLVEYAAQVAAAVVVVFFARGVVVYPLVAVLNRVDCPAIPRSYQHVLTWSGIHASVSIALVLGVQESFPGPLAEQLSALVFGVAGFTLLVNGSTMGALIDRLSLE